MYTEIRSKCHGCGNEYGELREVHAMGFYTRCPVCNRRTKAFKTEGEAIIAWKEGNIGTYSEMVAKSSMD